MVSPWGLRHSIGTGATCMRRQETASVGLDEANAAIDLIVISSCWRPGTSKAALGH